MAEFALPLSDVDQGSPKEKHFVIRADWVRGALEETQSTTAGKDGTFDVKLSRSGNDVVLTGDLHVELSVPCARCLEPFPFSIDAKVSALLVPAAKSKVAGKAEKGDDDEYEFSETEADTVPYDGETLVFDDVVRDELVLETPMIPLCSEDCPGMKGAPSEEPNEQDSVDPRFAVLKQIKLK